MSDRPVPVGPAAAGMAADEAARQQAVDPRRNVALEASAGTGKTRVLVDRYLNLLAAGVPPRHILAITFTRKAAAEMRERIVGRLRGQVEAGTLPADRWQALADQLPDIAISTIDAFCLALLREFPLEADVDPGFQIADETETPALIDEALDRALRIGRAASAERDDVALVLASLGEARLRRGLARLLDRRLVVEPVLARAAARVPHELTADAIERRGAARLAGMFGELAGGHRAFLESGPRGDPRFDLLRRDLTRVLDAEGRPAGAIPAGAVRAALARLHAHLFTTRGTSRRRPRASAAQFRSRADHDAHARLSAVLAPHVDAALEALHREVNGVLVRGVYWLFRRVLDHYRGVLEERAVLDFTDALGRTIALLGRMEEFSRSRYRLEARYQHVLVDEFQDTSRPQWALVGLLVRSWGEGAGLAGAGRLPPSVFVVGDRKQSIYGFRDADPAILDEAAQFIQALRPEGDVRRAIVRSFRARPAILAFVNDLFDAIDKDPDRPDAFRYSAADRFPIPDEAPADADDALGVVAASDVAGCARAVAAEIAALIDAGVPVRDRATNARRPAGPGDVAILFRTRESHREFERELDRVGVPFYVYKGLGFFDAEEIQDALALVHYLADPWSDLRAAALLRSRLVGLSDEALKLLAPGLAAALAAPGRPTAAAGLAVDDGDLLDRARRLTEGWRALTDRVPPAELLDRALAESAYAVELRGRGLAQARENLKKVGALVRRIQNRGYATMRRVAEQLARLAVGDESNAVVDALDAVNLMTVHAAKGLEFPVVFVVNLSRGTAGGRDPIRVARGTGAGGEDCGGSGEDEVAIGDIDSPIDRQAARRDREETKRLLYVALTRARDRLYLATPLGRNGRFRPSRGSLGEVLPASLHRLFERAAQAAPDASLVWSGPRGTHAFSARARDAGARRTGVAPRVHRAATVDDFDVVEATRGARHRAVTGAAGQPDLTADAPRAAVRGASALAGLLVHRAFRTGLAAPGVDRLARRRALGGLVRDRERAGVDRLEAILDAADRSIDALAANEDLQRLLAGGRVYFELPFSLARPGDDEILRGAIDALVVSPGGKVTVIELKTGAASALHAAQLALYEEAARALFPGAVVEGRLIYAGPPG